MEYISNLLLIDICNVIHNTEIGSRNMKDQHVWNLEAAGSSRCPTKQPLVGVNAKLLVELHNTQQHIYNYLSSTYAGKSGRPSIISIPITWIKPIGNWLKLNTDGCSNISKNATGIGGTVRNNNGVLMMAFAKGLQFCTNNSAELRAALEGLLWCHYRDMKNVILEMDS
ncbi:hypothetical protein HAX54_040100 [Datura stramonium]|uniref:RNase H type-1 domain-containing protein n=1 Tax=Datura stramonium TaxID=4076 RepID=A0ABS8SJX1_DATST|nr:hypothetical protein [Datura stramonium]